MPVVINFSSANAKLNIIGSSENASSLNLTLLKISKTIFAPAGKYMVSGLNISASPNLIEVIETEVRYPCSLPAGSVTPYFYQNGTWIAITQYHVNSTSCTVSFSVLSSGNVAVFSNSNPATAGQNPYIDMIKDILIVALAILVVHYFGLARRFKAQIKRHTKEDADK